MFWKCLSFDINKIWPVLLVVITLKCHVEAAETTAGCKNFIIAATLGTFGSCFVVFAVIVFLVYRWARKAVVREESQRKCDLKVPRSTESIHFENLTAINQDKDDTDSGIASPVSPTMPSADVDQLKPTNINVCTQTVESAFSRPKPQSVVIEKRQNGGLGLSFAIAGLYVKAIDGDVTDKQLGNIEPGDEILSINGMAVEGMTDMEALALVANSGPTVQLLVVKRAFLWRVNNTQSRTQTREMRKRNPQSSQSSLCDQEALKKAKLEICEALMELRRCTSSKNGHASCLKSHEKTNSQQSFVESIEIQRSAVEEDFVVIDSAEEARSKEISASIRTEALNGNGTSGELTAAVSHCDAIHATEVEPSESQRKNSDDIHPVATSTQNALRVTEAMTNGMDSSSVFTKKAEIFDELTPPNPKGLSLPLKTSIVRQQRTSSPEEQKVFPLVNGGSSSSIHGSSVTDLQGPAYFIAENGQVASPLYYSADEEALAVTYVPNLDRIKPPPSYEIASLTFNSQKPWSQSFSGGSAAGTPIDYKIPMSVEPPQVNSIQNSTNSSFDDLDSAIPALYSNSSRDSFSIEERVITYMNKKYSEPRFSTNHFNPPDVSSSLSSISPSSSDPRFIEPAYVGRSRSGSDYTPSTMPFVARSSYYLRKFPNDVISGAQSMPPGVFSGMYEDDTHNGLSHYNDNEHTPRSNDFVRYPNRATNSLTDIYRELSSSFDNPPNGTITTIPTSGNIPKNVLNRPGRQLKQRIGETTKNIRRAASSPSVNAEHQRGGSTESYSIDSQAVPRRQRNQKTRKSRGESFDRRKSIDSGSLRKLAAELQSNQSLSDDLPMLSRLLGGMGVPDAGKPNNLYRYNSSDTLY